MARSSSSPTGGVRGSRFCAGMARACGFAPRDQSHTARITGFAKLLYPHHPLFRADGDALEIIAARSDMLVTRLPDGTHRGVPAWMFNEEACASIRNAPQPGVDITSLLEIAELLARNKSAIRSAGDECKSPSPQSAEGTFATVAGDASIRASRTHQPDPGRKEGRVHRVAPRTARSSQPPSSEGRRVS